MRGRSAGAAGNGAGAAGVVRADTEAGEGAAAEAGGSPALARLYIAGPPATRDEVLEARRTIGQGIDLLRWEGCSRPSLRDVIWRLFVDAMETDRKMKDPEARYRFLHNSWDSFEQLEEFGAATQRLQMGEEGLKAPVPRVRALDSEAEFRMGITLGWLRFVSARPDLIVRNRLVFLSLAAGNGVAWTRAKYFRRDRSDSAVKYVKFKVLMQIETALRAMHIQC